MNAISSIAYPEVPKESYSATVEDASDEEDHTAPPSKTKKKKRKKKKKSASVQSSVESMATATIDTAETPTSQKQASPPSDRPTSPKLPASKAPSFTSSTTSLPISQTAPQSGRSYLKSLNIKFDKKTKSRPDHASIFSAPETDKKDFLSNVSVQKDKEEVKTTEVKLKEAKKSWFSKLGKKTADLMRQLLGTSKEKSGNMKWDDFVKVR
jgi:hypothetical protein